MIYIFFTLKQCLRIRHDLFILISNDSRLILHERKKKDKSNSEDNHVIENCVPLMMIYLYGAVIGNEEKRERVDQLFGREYKHVKGIRAYYKRI